jgi:hypothetical protein
MMEHLIIWLIHAIIKAVTQKPKSESRPAADTSPQISAQPVRPNGPPTDVWAEYRRKQAAIERDMNAKSPSASKR